MFILFYFIRRKDCKIVVIVGQCVRYGDRCQACREKKSMIEWWANREMIDSWKKFNDTFKG